MLENMLIRTLHQLHHRVNLHWLILVLHPLQGPQRHQWTTNPIHLQNSEYCRHLLALGLLFLHLHRVGPHLPHPLHHPRLRAGHHHLLPYHLLVGRHHLLHYHLPVGRHHLPHYHLPVGRHLLLHYHRPATPHPRLRFQLVELRRHHPPQIATRVML